MELLFFWILCGIATGFIGAQRGGIACAWLAIGLLLGPIGLLMAFAAGPAGKAHRTCPFCAETVKREALVCRFCGRDLPPLDEVPRTAPERHPIQVAPSCSPAPSSHRPSGS